MQIHINPGDELPIYRQIMRQVTDAVAGGRLRCGEKLPSQRELAEQLVISHLTVKKAYEELERQGVIETRRGRGTFVSDTPSAADPAAERLRFHQACRRLVSQAYLGGISWSSLIETLGKAQQELEEERGGSANLAGSRED